MENSNTHDVLLLSKAFGGQLRNINNIGRECIGNHHNASLHGR
jgi:hypothetical protein